MRSTVRAVIGDNQLLFVEGLKFLLKKSRHFKFDIVGQTAKSSELLPIITNKRPDLLLCDLNFPERDGLDALRRLRSKFPDLRIILVTMYNDPKLVKGAFKAGVNGIILKSNGLHTFEEALKEVLLGKSYLADGIEQNGHVPHPTLHDCTTFVNRFSEKFNLTKRELEIFKLIAQALSNKEIASELYISDQTVSVHRKNIMRKLGVSNTASLIKIAYDHSVV